MNIVILLVAILVLGIILLRFLRGVLKGVVLFIIVFAVIITVAILGVGAKPDILPVSIHNSLLEVHAGKFDFEVPLDEVVSVDAIAVDGGVQVSGAAGGHIFNAKINKWLYKFALKETLQENLGKKFKDKTSGY